MSRFYENQFKTRFYSGMMKLSLLLIALLVGFATTYAQSGKTVTVSNDTELQKALGDETIETIELEAGFYDYFDQTLEAGGRITKFPEGGSKGECGTSNTVVNACLGNYMQISASTNGAATCPPDIGQWTAISWPGYPNPANEPSIVSPTFLTTQALGPVAGEYVIEFKWDGPDGYFTRANVFTREIPLFEVSNSASACENDACIDFTVTVTNDHTLPVSAQARPPYSTRYVVGGVTYTLSIPLGSNGVHTATANICLAQAEVNLGINTITFTYLSASNQACPPNVNNLVRTAEFFDIPTEVTATSADVCALTASLTGAHNPVGYGIPTYLWTKASGPGTATFTLETNLSPTVQVSAYGQYTFQLAVTNGECGAVTNTVTVNFYDVPTGVTATSADVCALTANLTGFHNLVAHGTPTYLWTLVTPAPGTATFTLATNLSPSVQVSVYGQYTFQLAVTNGVCGVVTNTVTVNFYDTPTGVTATSADVCALTASLKGAHNAVVHGIPTYLWTKTSGPGTATFTLETNLSPTVQVSAYGQYTFQLAVTNGECGAVTNTVTVNFYDVPTGVTATSADVCALTANLTGAHNDVAHGTPTYLWTLVTPAPGTATFTLATNLSPSVQVSAYGQYTFQLAVTNGVCGVVTNTVTVNFYDTPTGVTANGADVCALTTSLTGFHNTVAHGTPTYLWTKESGPGTATFTLETNLSPTVQVSAYGQYTFQLAVTNGVCGAVTNTVTVNFYDIPTGLTVSGPDVCGLNANLSGDHTAVVHGTPVYLWSVVDVPVGATTPTFGTPAAKTTTVTATTCGEYEFRFSVTNGECKTVSETTKVYFYDTPEPVVYHPTYEVCGYVTTVTTTFTAACLGVVGTPTETITENVGNPGDATINYSSINDNWNIEVDECGLYNFTYKVENGLCTATETFSITFYEQPEFEISGTITPTLCKEVDYTVYDLRDCTVGSVTYTWSIIPSDAGYFSLNGLATLTTVAVGNASSTVSIVWEEPGTATLTLNGKSIEGCENNEFIVIDAQYPKIAGQVKYWNEVETFMPTPFPTEDYATYPHDYFYVTLWNQDKKASADSITTVKVEPYLYEEELTPTTWNLYEYMSYFEFDLGTVSDVTTWFGEYGCEGYFISIWDGGLHYYNLPGGSGLNPPLAARQLGANYTYNNWGGVNALDALAIQLMASQTDISIAPYNYSWVGSMAWTPRFGYFSHSAADVNSSNPYTNGGITGLDALTTNYRSVGLLDVFPFKTNNPIQYSPNFRVTGRMVPELTYKMTYTGDGTSIDNIYETWPKPFDYNITSVVGNTILGTPTLNNPDDVPFAHSQNSYLYFTDARAHQYTSTPLSLLKHNFINVYYLALGDLNSSHVPTSDGFKVAPVEELLAYNDEMAVTKGDVVTVPVRITRNAELGAIALNFRYNTSLIEIVDVNYEQDYYNINAEEGTLRIGWYSMSPEYFSEGDAIALINVRIIGDITANTRFFELETGTEVANAEAVALKDITFETTALNSTLAPEKLFVTNYPNPFRNTTTISYYLPKASNVQLVVYNKMGQVIETLVNGNQSAGSHKVEFGRTELMQGIYHYKIIVVNETGATSETNSMIFIK